MRSRKSLNPTSLAALLLTCATIAGCIGTPGPQYQYAKYPLQGTGYLTDQDIELLNQNGRNGWRAAQIINEKYILLERER